MINMTVIGEYKVMNILAIQNKKFGGILTWETLLHHHHVEYLKTADRRAKRMEIWDLGYYSAYTEGIFHC